MIANIAPIRRNGRGSECERDTYINKEKWCFRGFACLQYSAYPVIRVWLSARIVIITAHYMRWLTMMARALCDSVLASTELGTRNQQITDSRCQMLEADNSDNTGQNSG